MEVAQQIATLIAGVVAVLAAVFSIVAVIVLLKSKTEALERSENSIRQDIKEFRDSLNALATVVKVSSAEQQVILKMYTATVEGIIARVNKLEEDVKKWKS